MKRTLTFETKKDVNRLCTFLDSGDIRYEIRGLEIKPDRTYVLRIEIPEKHFEEVMELYYVTTKKTL